MTEQTTPQITLKRVEPACPPNEEIRAKGGTHGIIYESEVYIDGIHRATFAYFGPRRYELVDVDRKEIRAKLGQNEAWFVRVNGQAAFADTIRACLTEGVIPTVEQIEQRRQEAAEQIAAEELARIAAEAKRRIESKAEDTLRALERLTTQITANPVLLDAISPAELESTLNVIAEARGITV